MQMMKEGVQEHLYVPIGFGAVSASSRAKRGPASATSAASASTTSRSTGNQRLALPEVSIVNVSGGRKSKLKHSERRCFCFKMSSWYKLGLLVLGCTFYKELLNILSMNGHDDITPPSIFHDYSSITSPYDLSSRDVDPWCAVSPFATNIWLHCKIYMFGSLCKMES